jgi:hypothetical protein
VLEQAVDVATDMMMSSTVSQSEVDAATEALLAAIELLEIKAPPVVVTVDSVVVSGPAAVGLTVTASAQVSRADAVKSYQWYRGTAAIEGAVEEAYTVRAADVCHVLSVRVEASFGGETASGVSGGVGVGFADVPVGNSAYVDVCWMAQAGHTTGTVSAGGVMSFNPTGVLQRHVMASWLYALAGSPEYEAPAVSRFNDVYTSSQFYSAVDWIVSAGLVDDMATVVSAKTQNTLFVYAPTATVSRAEFARVLYRFALKFGHSDLANFVVPGSASFTDVPVSHASYEAVEWLKHAKVVTGTNGLFSPNSAVSRSAYALMVHRFAG